MKDNNQIVSNVIWRFFERFGTQLITFIVMTVLARHLTPDEYGTVSLVVIFIAILQVFVDSGMGNALIQKKNADHLDFSSVFYFNTITSVVLYLLMFVLASPIAYFFDEPELVPIIRVLSLVLVASGIRNVQQAYVSRHLQFKRFFYATIIGTMVSGAVGIWMAYRGYGVWAMVARQLVSTCVDTFVLWIIVEWKPKWEFSIERIKGMFSFGWKILLTGLLDVVYSNVRQLVIGKLYTSADLAFHTKGKQIPELVGTNINMAIDGVLLPTMSAVQDEREQVTRILRKASRITGYIMAPLLIGLLIIATPLVRLWLTDKWLGVVPYLQAFCVFYLFYPHQLANRNALKSIGRSDIVLKMEIFNKIIGFGGLLISMWFGVWAITISLLVTTAISQILISTVNWKMFGYSFKDQARDVLPSLGLALMMGVAIYFIAWLPLHDALILLIQILLGACIYVALSWIFRMSSFLYILSILKSSIKKKG